MDKMTIKIALAGNPNCGKTTLFNGLTGSNQFVGNWPGVTVEKKEGSSSLSTFQTLIVSTATRVGMGNLVGVVAAVSIGGAGSVFWMWVTALIGSIRKKIRYMGDIGAARLIISMIMCRREEKRKLVKRVEKSSGQFCLQFPA